MADKLVCASIFFTDSQNRILLFLRDKEPILPRDKYPNTWDVFGGQMEGIETPLQCVVREMEEELGIQVAPNQWRVIEFAGDDARTDFVFAERLPWGEYEFNEANKRLAEGQRIGWFTLDEVRGMEIAFGWRPPVIEYLAFNPQFEGESSYIPYPTISEYVDPGKRAGDKE